MLKNESRMLPSSPAPPPRATAAILTAAGLRPSRAIGSRKAFVCFEEQPSYAPSFGSATSEPYAFVAVRRLAWDFSRGWSPFALVANVMAAAQQDLTGDGGVLKQTTKAGTGSKPEPGMVVFAHYTSRWGVHRRPFTHRAVLPAAAGVARRGGVLSA